MDLEEENRRLTLVNHEIQEREKSFTREKFQCLKVKTPN